MKIGKMALMSGAAAMAMMIVLTSGTVRAAHWFVTKRLLFKANAWRSRSPVSV